jgi:Ras-related protein Rab-4B
LSTWLSDARAIAQQNLSVIVVGNKLDLKETREVTLMESSRFCQEHEVPLIEASAATGENIQEIFTKLTKAIMGKLDSGLLENVHGVLKTPRGDKPVRDRVCNC